MLSEQVLIFFQIIFIDLVLAGDNAIIIGMVASQFPSEQRKKIIFWGIGAAVVLAGQVYIGLGYRAMTQSVNDLAEVFTLIRESNELKSGRYPNLY